ncbi:R51A1 protein, partial [Indicator maculatus]|nr:R51A1 protein [Indicator maculatus]
MDDDIPGSDCRQNPAVSKVPAHEKSLTVDSDDRDHAADSDPEAVPISPLASPSPIREHKSELTQKMSNSSQPIGRPLHTSSPVTDKKPKWIPPAASGSSNNPRKYVSVKSPTQCLRLGLSRLARVKPLHPSATSS